MLRVKHFKALSTLYFIIIIIIGFMYKTNEQATEQATVLLQQLPVFDSNWGTVVLQTNLAGLD